MDKSYLYEIALILESAETDQNSYGVDEVRFIKIEVNTAKDIAVNLRRIASRMTNMVH